LKETENPNYKKKSLSNFKLDTMAKSISSIRVLPSTRRVVMVPSVLCVGTFAQQWPADAFGGQHSQFLKTKINTNWKFQLGGGVTVGPSNTNHHSAHPFGPPTSHLGSGSHPGCSTQFGHMPPQHPADAHTSVSDQVEAFCQKSLSMSSVYNTDMRKQREFKDCRRNWIKRSHELPHELQSNPREYIKALDWIEASCSEHNYHFSSFTDMGKEDEQKQCRDNRWNEWKNSPLTRHRVPVGNYHYGNCHNLPRRPNNQFLPPFSSNHQSFNFNNFLSLIATPLMSFLGGFLGAKAGQGHR